MKWMCGGPRIVNLYRNYLSNPLRAIKTERAAYSARFFITAGDERTTTSQGCFAVKPGKTHRESRKG